MKLFFNMRVILFMFTFLFGCSSFGHQSPRYVQLAHEITEKTAKQLEEQKSLYLVGTGGQMMHDIQMMAMSFYYYQEVNLKAAREFINLGFGFLSCWQQTINPLPKFQRRLFRLRAVSSQPR